MSPTWILPLALVLAVGDDKTTPRKSHPHAPSLPLLTDKEEKALDDIIERFIEYDTGKLRGPEGLKALREFERLGPEAIPALIRGLNRAAEINHSCPVTVIAKKLHRLLSASRDVELLDFAREEIAAGVRANRHAAVLQDLRVAIMVRKGYVIRAGIAYKPERSVTARPRTPKTMNVKELAEAAGRERGEALKQVIIELGQRKEKEAVFALATAIGSYERDIQTLARSTLQKNLHNQTPDILKQMLADENVEIRRASVRVVLARGLRFGGELIERLEDEDAEVRDLARQALVRLARGVDYGPAKNASEQARAASIARWRQWWNRQGSR